MVSIGRLRTEMTGENKMELCKTIQVNFEQFIAPSDTLGFLEHVIQTIKTNSCLELKHVIKRIRVLIMF